MPAGLQVNVVAPILALYSTSWREWPLTLAAVRGNRRLETTFPKGLEDRDEEK